MFYFTSQDGLLIYMGRDKYENETLIKYGWPEDIWFHVDDMSSAHVYLRLPQGQGIDDISPETLDECCQLVKANSIQGSKLASVMINYTPWENLHKRADMDVGQIGYHNERRVRKIRCDKDKDVLKRVARTKVERDDVDMAAERAARDQAEIRKRRAMTKAEHEAAKKLEEARRKEKETRSYSTLFKGRDDDDFGLVDAHVAATSDATAAKAYEDDFM